MKRVEISDFPIGFMNICLNKHLVKSIYCSIGINGSFKMSVSMLYVWMQLTFCSTAFSWLFSRCPRECRCQLILNLRTTDCSLLYLEDFPEPETIPADVEFLNLSHNGIKHIPMEFRFWFPDLIKIDLSYNNFAEVPTLRGFNQLRHVNLSHNQIIVLPPNLFHDLQHLQELSLDNNRISLLDESSFSTMKSLTLLHLSHNHLSTPPILRNSTQLVQLNLEKNRLYQILPDALITPLLEELNLNNNEINWIHHDAFSAFTQLKILNLGNNQFTNVPQAIFRVANTLKILDLASNDIDNLKIGDFYFMPKIELIDISGNKIAFINENIFVDLPQLNSLRLNDNKLLLYISPKAFSNLPSLTSINLHNACLIELFDIPSVISSIKYLSVYNNPLICNCHIYWMRNSIRKGIISDDLHKQSICSGSSPTIYLLRALDLMHCDNQLSSPVTVFQSRRGRHKKSNTASCTYQINNQNAVLNLEHDDEHIPRQMQNYIECFGLYIVDTSISAVDHLLLVVIVWVKSVISKLFSLNTVFVFLTGFLVLVIIFKVYYFIKRIKYSKNCIKSDKMFLINEIDF